MIKKLQMYFQVSNYKRRDFIYINNNNSNFIYLSHLFKRWSIAEIF